MLVTDFGNVKQTAHTTDVDKGAVWLDATNGSDHHFAHFKAIHLALDEGAAMTENQTIALFVDFKEFERQEVCNQLFFRFAGTDVGSRNEATKAFHPNESTTTVGGEHF